MSAVITFVDQSDRDIAASELDKNVLVIAGAGTGKTTLLIERLLGLILSREIPVDQIVALTFTKKAAEEMRERLENRLRRILNGEEKFLSGTARAPELAKQALEDIPKAQIGTIHSFAGHLLRLYPLQSGVDPKFREDEGSVLEVVFEREWLAWAAAEFGEASARSERWQELFAVVPLEDLKELCLALVSPMVDLSRLDDRVDLRLIGKGSLSELDGIEKSHERSARATKFNEGLTALRTLLEQLADGKPVDQDLIALMGRFSDPPAAWEDAKSTLIRLKNRAKALAEVDDALLAKVVEGILPLAQTVRAELRRVGAVAFDGLLVFARNLLRDHRDVRRALKKRFAAFLVDEFQDTDPLQGEILFYLAEDPALDAGRWQDVKLGDGRLFVVGDPKQSIYRFRGADIGAFEEFQKLMEKQGAARATLATNFRSDENILNFVNGVFPAVMREQTFIQPPYLPLEAHKKSDGSPTVLVITVGAEDGEEKFSSDEGREAEAAAIADWIKTNMNADPLRYQDVALLFRSAHAFRPYLEALRQSGIPYLAEGEKSFYRTAEVVDFLNLLSAVADPTDRLSLVGVLRSPIGGLTDAEILDLKLHDNLSYLSSPKSLAKKIGGFFAVLKSLHEMSLEKPVPDLINEIFEKTWMLEVASRAAHGEQAIANLLKIRLLAEKWGDGSPLTLKSFVRRFTRYRDDERDEGENPLADVKYNAVKVLTIHKAKGLEFPVVFLPNLSAGKRAFPDQSPLARDWRTNRVGLRLPKSRKTSAAMILVNEEIARREEAEEIRVFYVAATRAKEKVICLINRDAKDANNFSGYLKKAGVHPLHGLESIDVAGFSVPVQSYAWAEEEKRSVPRIESQLPAEWDVKKLSPAVRKREKERQDLASRRLFLSPTRLMQEPEKRLVMDEESVESAPDPIMVGVICHKILEEWNFSAEKKEISSSLQKAVKRAGGLFELVEEDPASQRVLDESRGILTGFFGSESYQKLTKVKILGREIPFLYPTLDGGIMRGVIDLLYESDGKVVIADYKTTNVGKKNIKAITEHYRPQAEAYREAIKRSLGKDSEFELVFLRLI